MELIEETETYLKFRINSLTIAKLISFLVERGKRDEFHLTELQLLLFSLNLFNLEIQSEIRQVINLIEDCLENQRFLSFEWEYNRFYSDLTKITEALDADIILKGEFTSYKGINKAEFQIQLT